MSEYDDWKQENDRWEAYLYPNGGTTSACAENTSRY